MTVYRDAEAARIDPKILGNGHTNSAVPAYLRRWFKEAHEVYNNEKLSYAYKAGYFYGIIQIVESHFTHKER